MSGWRFTLTSEPPERLDLSPLIPERLAGLSAGEIEHVVLCTTRIGTRVADVFTVAAIEAGDRVEFGGGSTRFDDLGHGMTRGTIVVEGACGQRLGRLMSGGAITVRGNAGGWAGSGIRGGTIEIGGDAGERLGGPLAGERTGMNGGTMLVRGRAGDRAGDRMRRGLIVVEGAAGTYAGSRMIAGTLVVCGAAGSLPGYLMRRGTMLLARTRDGLPPTFARVGDADLVFMRLLARALATLSPPAARLAARKLERYAGDMATLGKGELFLAG